MNEHLQEVQKALDEKNSKKTIKCIVWDLDHTLWNGILTEDVEVSLRDGLREVLVELDQRGILLSIASKNTYEHAMEKLQQLGIDQLFLYPQINWGPKSASLEKIREKLNIGMDAIAFIDDQPFEREEVQHTHEEISIYDIDVIDELLERPEFKPRFITEESAARRKMYLEDDVRKSEEESFDGANIEFLRSQQMRFTISKATVADLQRVEELTVRTNQLNASGYTYSYDELASFITSPDHELVVAELIDKHGTYGKIGVALLEKGAEHWTLKSMLMSCRVMSRGVGNVLLYYIMNLVKENDAKLLTEFLHTDKNRLMYMTLKFAGFTEFGDKLDNGRNLLIHNLEGSYEYPEYLTLTIE